MFPIVELLAKSEFELQIMTTAQHRDMLDVFLKTFSIKPDYDLNVMKDRQQLSGLTSRIIEETTSVLKNARPHLIMVQGDTTTAMATALAGFYRQIPIAHVEAGLRTDKSYDPFPEEMNRRLISNLANIHFAPTLKSEEALLKENISPEIIFRTGNTVIDAILKMAKKDIDFDLYKSLDIPIQEGQRMILVTAHRRENWGEPLENICQAIQQLCDWYEDLIFVFPVHKNPIVRVTVYEFLGDVERVHLVEPLDYTAFVSALNQCYLVLTDSGGIQEEAPALGKPVLVLRTTTERPEAIEMGTAKLVGVEVEAIIRETATLLDNKKTYEQMTRAINPYGDGRAAERILDAIRYYFKIESSRPTPFNV